MSPVTEVERQQVSVFWNAPFCRSGKCDIGSSALKSRAFHEHEAQTSWIRKWPRVFKIVFIAPLVYIGYEKVFETFGAYFGALDGSQSAIIYQKPSKIHVKCMHIQHYFAYRANLRAPQGPHIIYYHSRVVYWTVFGFITHSHISPCTMRADILTWPWLGMMQGQPWVG